MFIKKSMDERKNNIKKRTNQKVEIEEQKIKKEKTIKILD